MFGLGNDGEREKFKDRSRRSFAHSCIDRRQLGRTIRFLSRTPVDRRLIIRNHLSRRSVTAFAVAAKYVASLI